MPEVSFGISIAHSAWSSAVNRAEIIHPLSVLYVNYPLRGKKHTVPSVTGWHYTIEHVYTSPDCLKKVYRCSDPHEIPRFVEGQYFINYFNRPVHLFSRFSN